MKVRVPGLPAATPLRRYSPDQPLVDRPVLTGSAPGARIDLRWIPLAVTSHSPLAGEGPGEGSGPWSAIIFDATGISDVAGLSELHAFTAPAFRNLRPCGRLIVLGTPPEDLSDAAAAAAQRALDGFIRSAGKEARSGSTANLIYVGAGAESGLESTLRFFLSGRSAYVSGQVVRVRPANTPPTADWTIPLTDRVAVVTGAASGIAGNRGQTNYAASKAGIIGMVQALAPAMAKRDMTINAVAPGFIETAMTKAMPFATREIGRRINSLNQGGLPVDVAETVAWLGQLGTAGVNGQIIRVSNRISQKRPLRADERLTLRVSAADLREHPRGRQFDMLTEATIEGDRVWTESSTYLRRDPHPALPRERGRVNEHEFGRENAPSSPSAIWRVPRNIGRRYAAVSGDVNPIHLNPLVARLFGFRRAIAHGMWLKARCLAAFEGRLPDALTAEVEFKSPLLLPSTVGFASHPQDGDWTFAVAEARSGRPHLAGRVSVP